MVGLEEGFKVADCLGFLIFPERCCQDRDPDNAKRGAHRERAASDKV